MRSRLLISVCVFLVGAVFLSAAPRPADGFTLASLNGSYGSRETGDGHLSAGLGIVTYDGKGNTTRDFLVNAPDGSGGRQILQFPGIGTYTVNENGTGVATYQTTLPDGSVATRTFDFVITGTASAWHPGKASRIATEISTAQREAGVTVKLVTGIQTRIGD